jgi:hypothetical protein
MLCHSKLRNLALFGRSNSKALSAERIEFGKQLTVKGKPIMRWLRNCSPFTIYRLLFFTLCAMPFALCVIKSQVLKARILYFK